MPTKSSDILDAIPWQIQERIDELPENEKEKIKEVIREYLNELKQIGYIF